MMKDSRLGIWGEPIQWPETTVTGLPYTRPCTTLGIDQLHFVVCDLFPSARQEEAIAEVRKLMAGMSAAPKSRDTTK